MIKSTRAYVKRMSDKYREDKAVFLLYSILRILVVIVAVVQFYNRNYENVFLCILTLILFIVPNIFSTSLKIELPRGLQIIMLLFIYAAEILGEINSYYMTISNWDTMLHTINGFLAAAIGFALVDILCKSEKIKFELSPMFMALVAFCFSMTIGVLWEFFEYWMDCLFLIDMQKDTIIQQFSSAALAVAGEREAIISGITETTINGEVLPIEGYLDIGLHDTMEDLIVNFIGAIIFSFFGYFYIKSKGQGKIARMFIPFKRKKGKESNGES